VINLHSSCFNDYISDFQNKVLLYLKLKHTKYACKLFDKVISFILLFIWKSHVTMKKVVEHVQSNRLVILPVAQRLLWRWFYHLKLRGQLIPNRSRWTPRHSRSGHCSQLHNIATLDHHYALGANNRLLYY
jgi:hypothetical protein